MSLSRKENCVCIVLVLAVNLRNMEPVTVGKMAANRQKAIYTQHNLQIYMHTKFHKHFMNVHQN